MRARRPLWLAVLSLQVACTFAMAYAQPRIPFSLNGRIGELALLRLKDRKLVDWPQPGVVELSVETIEGASRLPLAARLAANGIEPDVGAYALFFELNPQLSRATQLHTADKLLLPKVAAQPPLMPLLEEQSHLVVIILDPAARNELNAAIMPLKDLATRFAQLKGARFRSTDAKRVVVRQTTQLAAWYEHILVTGRQRKGPPLSTDTLRMLRQEAQAVAAIIQTHLMTQGPLSKVDEEQIAAVHEDIDREIRRYDEVQSGVLPDPDSAICCPVVVTIKGDPEQVKHMRVYYTLNGLFRRPPPGPIPGSSPFTELGSGKTIALRAKNYQFWAVEQSHPDILRTQPVKAALRPSADKKPTIIELVIQNQKTPTASPTMIR